MLPITVLVFSVVTVSWSVADPQKEVLSFPPKFQFGVASSSYQVEGAWNDNDKGENIWDRFTHTKQSSTPGLVNGDVACDSYHLWRRDVQMLEELGVNFYRFSVSWSRILPNGFTNVISKEGTKYYSDLIDALLEKGIDPVVTLHHWDLPQRLQNLGGWANPLVSKWFADYARIVFSLYADRVKSWITINEPLIACDLSYQHGILAPGIISREGSFLCSKHMLMAHAKAWRVYDEEFRAKYHGRISLTNYLVWIQPLSEVDEDLAELAHQHHAGLYCHPIFSKEGGWPPAVEKLIADDSKRLGYPRSNLPSLTKEEIELLKGTYDFFALNYYTSRTIRKANESEVLQPWPADMPLLNAKLETDPSWESTASSFHYKYPEGIRKQLRWLKKEYGDLPFIIAENGLGNHGGLEDKDRIWFIRDHLSQILLSIKEDGVNVTAFTAWSLMDSFEWMDGYTSKYGLYEVDFSSPDRKRTPRASAAYYTRVINSKSLNVSDVIRVTMYVNTLATKTSIPSYIFIIGGVLVAVAIISVVVWQVRKRRMPAVGKNNYTGVQTEDLTESGF